MGKVEKAIPEIYKTRDRRADHHGRWSRDAKETPRPLRIEIFCAINLHLLKQLLKGAERGKNRKQRKTGRGKPFIACMALG